MKKYILVVLLLLLVSFDLSAQNEETILMYSGESRSIAMPEKINKAAIGNPEVADVKAVSAFEILITAKNEGATALILWVGKDKRTKKVIVSKVDAKAVLADIEPLIRNIRSVTVKIREGKVVVEGKLENEKDAAKLEDILNKFTGKIVNFVKLPVQMIKINARIVEMSSGDDFTAGIDWTKKFNFVEAKMEGLYKVGKIVRDTRVDAVLDFLAHDGSAKIIAKPNIIVINGKLASFHSGGKLLVPVINQNNVSVEEKPYGINLKILPFGDRDSNLVKVDIEIEVSSLDYQNAVTYADNIIPGIRDRRIETEIDVKVGTTIVIAGLMLEEEQQITKKVFILGSIPILGWFFSTTEKRKSKSELVVFLTPSFVNSSGEEILE